MHKQSCTCTRWSIYSSASKRKKILTQATTWMSPEDIILSGISQSRRSRCCETCLLEAPGAVRFMETGSRTWSSGGRARRMGSCLIVSVLRDKRSFRGWLHSSVTVLNTTGLHTERVDLLRGDQLGSGRGTVKRCDPRGACPAQRWARAGAAGAPSDTPRTRRLGEALTQPRGSSRGLLARVKPFRSFGVITNGSYFPQESSGLLVY